MLISEVLASRAGQQSLALKAHLHRSLWSHTTESHEKLVPVPPRYNYEEEDAKERSTWKKVLRKPTVGITGLNVTQKHSLGHICIQLVLCLHLEPYFGVITYQMAVCNSKLSRKNVPTLPASHPIEFQVKFNDLPWFSEAVEHRQSALPRELANYTNVSNWHGQVANGRRPAQGVCGCVCAMLMLCMWVGVYSHKHTFPHACKTDAVTVSGVRKVCCDTKLR